MHSAAKTLSITQVLACGAAIVTLSMGIRHGFGLWLQPITQAQGWTRETFAFAIAIQNIAWGTAGIFAGMVADRFGAFRVIIAGALFYAAGLFGMAHAATPLTFALSTGVLIGIAQAGTTYAVVYGVIGRNVSAERRSWAMGITAAAGSFGQFLMVPTEGLLISQFGWQQALVLLGGAALLMVPLAWGLREPAFADGGVVHREQSIAQALREAFKYPSFRLLMAGYFVCGFQVVFIGVHMPSYLKDKGLSPQVASYALALIGLFNVFGTYTAGWLGARMPKRYILSAIYLTRAISIAIFISIPPSIEATMIFAVVTGLTWLSTVPPTSSLVSVMFGTKWFAMLYGFVFFSHQLGSFVGVWLGGVAFEMYGSYQIVWWLAVMFGVLSALINLPIIEKPVARLGAPAA